MKRLCADLTCRHVATGKPCSCLAGRLHAELLDLRPRVVALTASLAEQQAENAAVARVLESALSERRNSDLALATVEADLLAAQDQVATLRAEAERRATLSTLRFALPPESESEPLPFRKDDAGKVRVELVPPAGVLEVGRAFTYGAAKYGADNWRRGAHWTRYVGAALRHVYAWACGIDADPESGLSHLAHASACLLILMEMQRERIGTDDRRGGGR